MYCARVKAGVARNREVHLKAEGEQRIQSCDIHTSTWANSMENQKQNSRRFYAGSRQDQPPVEGWWFTSAEGPFPGKTALFVGAGISISAPTSLPNGSDLTRALIRHLLDKSAADELLSVFEDCAPVLGRSIPRLEHVLERTCSPIDHEGFSRPGNPRDLLALFQDKTPNANHHMIVRHLLRHRGWCITTNFDDCIERAASFRIPVHILDAEQKTIRILHAEHGTDWGLIKVHGTIEEGVERLWATLADLQFGLPEAMRDRLDEVMRQVDAFVVAGYSGTDHFDVNHWIRDRANKGRDDGTPRLIWILHAAEKVQYPDVDEQAEPLASWVHAFAGTKYPMGPTTEILSGLLGIDTITPDVTQQTTLTLDQVLASLYQPLEAERHLNGARLAAAVGLGQRAEEELRILRHLLDDDDAAASIEPDIYFARGMANEALEIRAALDRAGASGGMVARTRMLRQQGRHLTALCQHLLDTRNDRDDRDRAEDAIDALACGLDIVHDLQRSWLFRTRIARRVMELPIDILYRRTSCFHDKFPIDLQGKLQTQNLRRLALFDDDDDHEMDPLLGKLWRLVHEQYSPPSWYIESRPLIHGDFLIEQSTAREQDRLAELVHIKLELADVLLSGLRRRWPRGIADVDREFRRKSKHSLRAQFGTGQICTTVLFQLLLDAGRIATALGEHSLQVNVAACWQEADRLLGGVSYWKRQRLYLPVRRPHDTAGTLPAEDAPTMAT